MVIKIFKKAWRSIFGNSKDENPNLNVYYYNGKTYITTFGSGFNFEKAKDITDRLLREGAESNSVGVAVFSKELGPEYLEIFTEEYNVNFHKAKHISEGTIEYSGLRNILESN